MRTRRGKGMSSRDLRDDRNTKGWRRMLSFMISFAPYAPFAEVIIGLIGLSAIGFLIFQTLEMKAQTARQTQALQLEATSAIYSGILDLDKTFLTYPGLRPYFYSGQVISPTDVRYSKVLSIAEYKLDLLDLFLQNSSHLREGQDWDAWENWIRLSFTDSPIMCTHLLNNHAKYGQGLLNITSFECGWSK